MGAQPDLPAQPGEAVEGVGVADAAEDDLDAGGVPDGACSGFVPAGFELGQAVADRDDQDALRVLLALQTTDGVESPDDGQAQIHQDYVRLEHGSDEECLRGIGNCLDEPPGGSHAPRVQFASVFVVIHDEDSRSSARPSTE